MSKSHYEYDFTSAASSEAHVSPFRLELKNITRTLMAPIAPRMADLLEVVMAVYAADRQSRRNYRDVNTGQRDFLLRVELRDPKFWSRPELMSVLQAYLNWISGDHWTFEFVTRQTDPTPEESELYLFDSLPQQPISVSLFSGGLDSLAGLSAHRRDNRPGSHLLVSGYSHGSLMKRQRLQARKIESVICGCGSELDCPVLRHITVGYGLCRHDEVREEKTQRTRATAFLTFGVITAVLARTDTLWVFENGTGALNLPLNATQLGVDNYRGVHPRSLIMAEELFELAMEQKVRIINPFVFHTKAQMIRALAPSGMADLARETVSCDSFPLRVDGHPQCGYCTSCILRRQALFSGGLSGRDLGRDYQYDVLTDGHMLDGERRFGLGEMREQARTIRLCLSAAEPWRALTAQYPELARTALEMESGGGVSPGDAAAGIVRLYQNYVREWDALPPAFSGQPEVNPSEAA